MTYCRIIGDIIVNKKRHEFGDKTVSASSPQRGEARLFGTCLQAQTRLSYVCVDAIPKRFLYNPDT